MVQVEGGPPTWTSAKSSSISISFYQNLIDLPSFLCIKVRKGQKGYKGTHDLAAAKSFAWQLACFYYSFFMVIERVVEDDFGAYFPFVVLFSPKWCLLKIDE